VVKDSFSHTPTGLGVGILGAIVGGLAAREASDATVRARNRKFDDDDHNHRPQGSKDYQKSKIISTVAGAIIGGLGANAIEKRFEVARGRDKDKQESWERKFGKESELPHYDTGNDRERDHGLDRSRARRRDEDDGDYVYDDRRRLQRMRSEDGNRYRN
jgi:hypothetical protein